MDYYQDKNWQDSMRIRVDFQNMMQDALGPSGISKESIAQMQPAIDRAAASMADKRSQMQWRELPYQDAALLEDIKQTAKEIRTSFDNFVVLGIGGSALGPIAVQQALQHMHYNLLPREKRNGPRLFVEDNIDPERMAALFDVIDVKKTMFLVITKSGSTSETMSQLLIITNLLKRIVGENISKHMIAITDAEKGNLIKISKELGLKTFYIPGGVGGRFSELSPVGLLPAAVCGIDIDELLAGAAYMDKLCSEQTDIWKNPAYMLATLQVLAMEKGCNIGVMMPYADSLKYIADWYAQLWAESLGKAFDLNGNKVHVGQTPVKALGVTDQHSQVQLYTEGPFDKVVTFLCVDQYRQTVSIPLEYPHLKDVSFLSGHTLNELIQAEQFATQYALHKSERMSNSIILPQVNPFTIGQLLYLFEVQTAFAGELLNINAFDQPGVEEGKNATYALLGKPGYEEKKAELEQYTAKNPDYIIG